MFASRIVAAARPLDEFADLPATPRFLLSSVSHTQQSFAARQPLMREGERQHHCFVLLSGIAHRDRITADGQRQITDFYVRGDLIGLDGAQGGPPKQSVAAATPVTVAAIGLVALADVLTDDALLAGALWRNSLDAAAAAREWIVNIGRRDARARLLNLLCELSLRFEAAGMGTRSCFELPLTQSDLADATGLTSVHVNRVLRSLQMDGIIERRGRLITVPDWQAAARFADFDVPASARSAPLALVN